MRFHQATIRAWALLGVVALAAGCDDDGPPPDVRVVSAQEIGILGEAEHFVGRDGGYSVSAWGQSLWVFGDTVLTVADASGETWHHNSYSVTDDLIAADGIDDLTEPTDIAGAPVYFIAPTPAEEAFNVAHRGPDCVNPCGARWAVWPGEPIYDASADRLIIPYGLIYAEPGDFTFWSVGASFAIWDSTEAAPRRPVVDATQEHPTLLFPDAPYEFALGPQIIDGDYYVFACFADGFERPCVLGRVPLTQLLERDAWRYWTGEDWGRSPSAAARLFNAASIMTVHWNAYLNAWMAVYAPPLEDRIVLRTAPDLTGPWSGPLELFTAQRGGDSWVYDAVAHAEFAEQDGRVQYITFSRSTGEGWFDTEFPIWRVELEPTTR